MLRSMFTAMSAIRNHQTRLDVVSNNIANVNTTGFKKGRVDFQDLLSQTISGASAPSATGIGGINPRQIGLGMTVGAIDTLFDQGNLQLTGLNTDLAIQGNGTFILSDGNLERYSRAGNFTLDADGSLVSATSGWYLQGWQADATGVIDTSATPTNITVPLGSTIPANATSNLALGYNLDATVNGSLALNVSTHTVTDTATGNQANIAWTFTPTGNFNEWTVTGTITNHATNPYTNGAQWNSTGNHTLTYTVTTNSAGLVTGVVGGPGATDTIEDSGAGLEGAIINLVNVGDTFDGTVNDITDDAGVTSTLDTEVGITYTAPSTHTTSMNVYDSLGSTHSITLTFTKTGNNAWSWAASGGGVTAGNGTLQFNTDGSILNSTVAANIALTVPPAAAMTVTPDFTDITQYADDSNLIATHQDGYASGSLVSFNIGDTGVISGTYTNGQRQDLAQVALAHFINYGGLLKESSNMFSETGNSGTAQIGIANNGGRGSISAGSIEMSNVDLAEEFISMISAERAFQANSRSVTTSDEILQELMTLKR
jgi:flagellar hook protein FlgE